MVRDPEAWWVLCDTGDRNWHKGSLGDTNYYPLCGYHGPSSSKLGFLSGLLWLAPPTLELGLPWVMAPRCQSLLTPLTKKAQVSSGPKSETVLALPSLLKGEKEQQEATEHADEVQHGTDFMNRPVRRYRE